MPQPVHFSRPIMFEFVPDAVRERPDLAVHIAIVSSLWNEIEARIAAFLSALAGGDETVMSIFLAIQNDGAKRSTIDIISSLKLSPHDHQRFKAILKSIRDRYADRNRMVHGSWGISPEYPDKLLWADIRETTLLHVRLVATAPDKRRAKLLEAQKMIQVYGQSDFLDIEKRLRATYDELRDFSRPFMEKAFGSVAKVDLPPILLRPQ